MTSPFRGSSAGAPYFRTGGTHAAELKLAYAVEQGLEVALLVGPPGLGKTTLLRRIADHAAAANDAVVDVFFPRLDADELLEFIDAELPQTDAAGEASEPRLRRVAARMRAVAEAGRGLLIAIDDAHLLRDPAAFDVLHLLLNLREREGVRMTVLLAGQTSLLASLARSGAFAQRIAVTATLSPMNRDETDAYLRHHLAASGHDADAFDDAAFEALHDRSAGIPRTVNHLCEMALLIAGADGRDRITAADIDAVAQECAALREAA